MSSQPPDQAVDQKLEEVRRAVVALIGHLVQNPDALSTVNRQELMGTAMLTGALTNALQAASGEPNGGHHA